jgi:uncharacterized protein YtpQ (UPF0354 family)
MNSISPADFQTLLVEHLRADGWAIEEIGPLEIRVALQGKSASGVFNLTTMYRHYLDGAPIGDIADALLRSLHEAGEASEPVAELDLKRLMPLLKPRALLDEVAKSKVDAIAWRPFITDDVIVTLVLDFPQSVRYLKAAEVEALHQSFDDLLDTALANLHVRSEVAAHQLGNRESGRMFILATMDGYDATRILLSPLLERLAAQVNGELVIGIPNRDFFIAFGNANPLVVGQIGQQVQKDAQSRAYPLTATLFTFRNGQLEVYGRSEST